MNNQYPQSVGRYTFRLFGRSTFLEDIATIVSLDSTFDRYHTDDTPEEADYQAIVSDWKAVGADMWYTINKYSEQETPKKEDPRSTSSAITTDSC